MKTTIGFFGGIAVSIWGYKLIQAMEQNNNTSVIIALLFLIYLLTIVSSTMEKEHKEEQAIMDEILRKDE